MAGAQRIRVAVAQLAYHPAAAAQGRSPLEDPLFLEDWPESAPSALRPPGVALEASVEARVRTLERRIREVHGAQLLARVTAILECCQRWGVQLLVLPEYSVAAELLPAIAAAAGEVMVVAGSHVIGDRELAGVSGGIYCDLGWQGDARAMQGCAAAPVLHRGRLVHLQGKLHAAVAGAERGRWPGGSRFAALDLAAIGVRGALGVLFGNDLFHQTGHVWREEIAPALGECELLAVLASPPRFTEGMGDDRLARAAEGLGAPRLLAIDATLGWGTRIAGVEPREASPFVGRSGLYKWEEAVLVADLDLDTRRATYLAAASLTYRVHPVADAYASWSEALARDLEDARPGDLEALRARCVADHDLLLNVGALMEDDARDRRLRLVADRDATITDLDHLRALTREVILPRACLPLDHLGPAMARAALHQLYSWLREEPRGSGAHPSMLAVIDHLKTALAERAPRMSQALRMPTPDLWSEAGLDALAGVTAAIATEVEAQLQAEAQATTEALAHPSAPAPAPASAPPPTPEPRPRAAIARRSESGGDLSIAGYGHLAALWRDRRRALLRDVDDAFEPPSAIVEGDGRPAISALTLLDLWARSHEPLALLLGEPGAGKSTLLIAWAERRWAARRARLPVVIRLRHADARDPLGLLLDLAQRPDRPEERARLQGLIARGRLLPCFDGLDEIAEPAAREAIAAALIELAAGGGRVLISSRADSLPPALARAGARRIALQPFSPGQVAALIGRISADERDRDVILGRLTGLYDLSDLVSRPLLLGMVLQTLGRLDPTTRIAPADVFEAYLARWQEAASGPGGALDADERALLLEALALTAWEGGEAGCTFEALRLSFLRELAPALAARPEAALVDAIRALPPGFVVVDGDALRFSHGAFVDFFVARALARHLHDHWERLMMIRSPSRGIAELVRQIVSRQGGEASSRLRYLDRWLQTQHAPTLETRNATALVTGLRDLWKREPAARAFDDDDDLCDDAIVSGEADEADEAVMAEERAAQANAPFEIADEVEAERYAAAGDEVSGAEAMVEEEATDDTPLALAPLPGGAAIPSPDAAGPPPRGPPPAEPGVDHPRRRVSQVDRLLGGRGEEGDAAEQRPSPMSPVQRASSPPPSPSKRALLSKSSLPPKHEALPLAPNRFLPGRPLDDPDLPGRSDILRELATLLGQPSPALLKGPRRSGKTSILLALEALEGERRPVLRRTLQAHARPHTPDDLARLIVPGLAEAPRPAEALWRELAGRDRDAPAPAILLDELALLNQGSDELFAWLRALGQEGLAGLVLAGSHSDWIDLIKIANRAPGSSFGNDYTVIELGEIDRQDAIRFLVATAPDDVPIDPELTATWICELCGGWPFYLQTMGYAVVEEVRSGRRKVLVSKEALHDLYERRLLRERNAVFRSRWSDLRPAAQALVLEEFERLRDTRSLLPPYRELPRRARVILSDADLIDAVQGWKIDRPFRDWLLRNLDELEIDDGPSL